MAAVGTPEGFDERVFGSCGLPDDSQDPAIHLPLELTEQRLERLAVALREALKETAVRLVLHV